MADFVWIVTTLVREDYNSKGSAPLPPAVLKPLAFLISLLVPSLAHCGNEQYLAYLSITDKSPRYVRSYMAIGVYENQNKCHHIASEYSATINAMPESVNLTTMLEPGCRRIFNYHIGDVIGFLKLFPKLSMPNHGAILLEVTAYESKELCNAVAGYYNAKIINTSIDYKVMDCNDI